MAIKHFEDLEVWKVARQLTHQIYRLTRTSTFSNDFGLRNQIQRAAVSIERVLDNSGHRCLEH